MYDSKELARNAPGMAIKDDDRMVDMAAMRKFRLERVQNEIKGNDCAAAILLGPINIRYATGTKNGQIFAMHTPTRSVVVPAEGKATMFGTRSNVWLPETVGEMHPWPMSTYFPAGERSRGRIESWAKQVAAVIRDTGGGQRVALDVCDPNTIHALEGQGLEIIAGEPLVEPRYRGQMSRRDRLSAASGHGSRDGDGAYAPKS